MHNSAETWLPWRDSNPTARGIGASRPNATRHDATQRITALCPLPFDASCLPIPQSSPSHSRPTTFYTAVPRFLSMPIWHARAFSASRFEFFPSVNSMKLRHGVNRAVNRTSSRNTKLQTFLNVSRNLSLA